MSRSRTVSVVSLLIAEWRTPNMQHLPAGRVIYFDYDHIIIIHGLSNFGISDRFSQHEMRYKRSLCWTRQGQLCRLVVDGGGKAIVSGGITWDCHAPHDSVGVVSAPTEHRARQVKDGQGTDAADFLPKTAANTAANPPALPSPLGRSRGRPRPWIVRYSNTRGLLQIARPWPACWNEDRPW